MAEVQQDNYNISFFKPTTTLAKKNARLTIILISVWAVAIFGFHALLKIIEKPTPEAAYINYEKVRDKVNNENASTAEYQTFAKSILSVTGKLSLADADKEVLNKAVSHAIFEISSEEDAALLTEKIKNFQATEGTDIREESYLNAKKEFSDIIAEILGVQAYNLEAKLAPFAVKLFDDPAYDSEQLEAVMSKYLIHNQSALTDFKLLGFPFHYFYTAVFLLILFVGLCWIFCIRTDRIYKKLKIDERV